MLRKFYQTLVYSISTFNEFDQNAKLLKTKIAKSGEYLKGKWHLKNVSETTFNTDFVKVSQWPVNELGFFNSGQNYSMSYLLCLKKMSATNLYSYIKHLATNKQRTTRYEVALWAKLVYPLACMSWSYWHSHLPLTIKGLKCQLQNIYCGL